MFKKKSITDLTVTGLLYSLPSEKCNVIPHYSTSKLHYKPHTNKSGSKKIFNFFFNLLYFTIYEQNVRCCCYFQSHGFMQKKSKEFFVFDCTEKIHYNFLTHCLELSADEARCFYPSPVIHKLFLDVHQQYFSSCSSKEAPESVVIILTLLPVCIIPIAVYMVIKRSNVK
uniref:Receptor activity modifying protein 2 n=1 Tax=Astyanax mexicanus TaxID=7994 RepID=A0A3B1ID69_ASTMX